MLMVVTPTASSCMRVFPRTTPCASRSLSTSGLLLPGVKPVLMLHFVTLCFLLATQSLMISLCCSFRVREGAGCQSHQELRAQLT